MQCASYCDGQMNQQDEQILTYNLYLLFSLCSTCFGRTIRPSSGAPSSKLYHAFGTFVQASLAAASTQQPDLPDSTNVPIVLRDTVY